MTTFPSNGPWTQEQIVEALDEALEISRKTPASKGIVTVGLTSNEPRIGLLVNGKVRPLFGRE